MNNWLSLILCIVYIFGIIGAAELLRHRLKYQPSFTRKVIHIGVGMMSWVVPFIFDSPWYFVSACLFFAVITFLDWRYHLFAAMASSDPSNLGTVYFPIAAAAVTIVFWENPPLMVAALMPLTWGDGIAPVIGRAFGKHSYTVWGHTRTLQGSAGFFVFGMLFTWLALWIIPGPIDITPLSAILPALVIMLLTTLVEAISIWGLDNLTITAGAIMVLLLWPF